MTLDDVETHLAGEDEAQVRWLSGGIGTRASVSAWIERNQESLREGGPVICLGIETTDGLVGMIEANTDPGLDGVKPGEANISYGLYPQHRGKGYASRAVGLLTAFLAGRRISSAVVRVDPANERSTQVALRCGFRRAGVIETTDDEPLVVYKKKLVPPSGPALPVPESSWLHPSVIVGPSTIHGSGLFASVQIDEGQTVEILGGTTMTNAELRTLIDGGARYDGIALGRDLNLRIAPADWPGVYGNHSCDPNLWMRDAVTVVSRRDVGAGEELTIDYATFTLSEDWQMDCSCGSPLCRGEISGRDHRRADLQERYRGHFTPAIQRAIDAADP